MSTHQRMWENKGHRPYWAKLHFQAFLDPFTKVSGFRYKDMIFVIDKNNVNKAYMNIVEMKQATIHFKEWWKDKEKVERYFSLLKEHFAASEKLEEQNKHMDFSKLSNDEIIKHIKKLAATHTFGYLFVTQPQHVLPLEEELKELLQGKDNADAIIAFATTPNLPLPFDKEKEAVAQHREKWQSYSDEEKEQALAGLVKEFGWFAGIEGEADYDKEHYKREIESNPVVLKEKEPIDVEPRIKELGNLIGVLSNQRIWCRWHGMTSRYYMKLCIKELEKRWNIPDLVFATVDEIEEYVETKRINQKEMQKRKQGYVATILDGKAVLLTGKAAEPYIKQVQETITETDTVTGRIANPGKVTGIARIVSFAAEDYHDQVAAFKQGEILVTGMTRPQIAHLCQKAAAIVTDEGGITSHASIISREFNVPCVIATHNATKIFKTGDKIEVDAEKGVVKRS